MKKLIIKHESGHTVEIKEKDYVIPSDPIVSFEIKNEFDTLLISGDDIFSGKIYEEEIPIRNTDATAFAIEHHVKDFLNNEKRKFLYFTKE